MLISDYLLLRDAQHNPKYHSRSKASTQFFLKQYRLLTVSQTRFVSTIHRRSPDTPPPCYDDQTLMILHSKPHLGYDESYNDRLSTQRNTSPRGVHKHIRKSFTNDGALQTPIFSSTISKYPFFKIQFDDSAGGASSSLKEQFSHDRPRLSPNITELFLTLSLLIVMTTNTPGVYHILFFAPRSTTSTPRSYCVYNMLSDTY